MVDAKFMQNRPNHNVFVVGPIYTGSKIALLFAQKQSRLSTN
jgi:hypothetical protein